MHIIVGNGDIRNMGQDIDDFNTVIRINNAIFNLNDDVGWKIDIWSTRYRHDHRTGLPMEFPGVQKEILKIYPHLKVWVYNNGRPLNQFCREITKKHGIFPTTGLLTLEKALLEYGSPVHAIGFDFLDKSKLHHYWDKKEVTDSAIGRHNMEREKKVFSEYEKKGDLIWLS